jgi:PAS domain S-box-containing protein
MQNLDSYKPRSISRTLSVGLIITLVLVAGLSLGVNFILSAREAKSELETRAEEYTSALTDALKVPLWDYSEGSIAAICASYAQNEFIAKLLVEDQKGSVLFKKEKVDQRLVVSRSKDIFYEGNLVGRVQIALASGYYTAVNRQLFQSFGLTIVIMIGTLLVMTSVLLRQFLKKPMSRFIKMVDAYAAGGSDAFKQGIPYSEFDPLVDVLDEMGEKVASQMRSIRKLNEDLEKRVQERTAELSKLSEAVEQSPVTVMITDKNGTIEYVNPSFSEVTGYSAKEAIGQNPRIVKSGNHPSSFYKELWDTILSGKTWRGEILNRKKSAEQFWESTSISAIKNDAGDITHFVAVKQDITDQKRAEKAIRESEERLSSILKTTNQGFWLVDNDTHTIDVNDAMCAILGRKKEEIIGRKIYEFMDEENIEKVRRQERVRSERKRSLYEVSLMRSDGKQVPCLVNASPLFDGGGNKIGSFGMFTDITERRHIEEDLKRNVEELELFNKLAIGREIKMIQLKQEINELLGQLGQAEKYEIVE